MRATSCTVSYNTGGQVLGVCMLLLELPARSFDAVHSYLYTTAPRINYPILPAPSVHAGIFHRARLPNRHVDVYPA